MHDYSVRLASGVLRAIQVQELQASKAKSLTHPSSESGD